MKDEADRGLGKNRNKSGHYFGSGDHLVTTYSPSLFFYPANDYYYKC